MRAFVPALWMAWQGPRAVGATFMAPTVADRAHEDYTVVSTAMQGSGKFIRHADFGMTIQTKGSDAQLKGGEFVFAELFEADCAIGSGKGTCEVACYPYTTLPGGDSHGRIKNCESWPNRPAVDIDVNTEVTLWVVGEVSPGAQAGEWNVSFQHRAELKGTYTPHVYLATEQGIKAEYWDNIWFVDSPVITRTEAEINFQWGTGAITTYGIDYVSARYRAKIKPPYDEQYTFYIKADDGARLWIDKNLIIDSWDVCCNEKYADVTLDSNTFHDFHLEYKDVREDAYLELRWASNSIAKTIVPQEYFYRWEHIDGSPLSPIVIGPGPGATTTSLVMDKTNFGVDETTGIGLTTTGVENHVYVQLRDVFGNTLESDDDIWDLTTLTGTTGNDATKDWFGGDGIWTDDNGDVHKGIWKVMWQAEVKTTSGVNEELAIKLKAPAEKLDQANWHIIDSPYTLVIDPAATSPDHSLIAPVQLTTGIAGELNTFILTSRDVFENERELGDDLVRIRFEDGSGGSDPDLSGHGTCAYNGNGEGKYECSYTLTKAGTYQPHIVYILLDGSNNEVEHPVRGVTLDTIDITPGDLHGPACTRSTPPTANIIAGSSNTFTVTARDEFSNIRISATTANTEWFVNIVSEDGTKIETACKNVVTNGGGDCLSWDTGTSGVFTVTWFPEIVGLYTFTIKVRPVGSAPDPLEIDGSPWIVQIKPADVSAPNSIFLSGTGHLYGTTNIPTEFLIQARDVYDNNIWNGDEMAISPNPNPSAAPTALKQANIQCGSDTSDANYIIYFDVEYVGTATDGGQYKMSYTPKIADPACIITVALGGDDNIAESPLTSVTILTGLIHAETTTVDTAWAGDKTGVAGVSNSFKIVPRDIWGNEIAAADGDFTFLVTVHDDADESTAAAFDGTSTKDVANDGKYLIEYTTNVARTYDRVQVELYNQGGLLGNYYTDYQFSYVLEAGRDKIDTTIDFDWSYNEPLAGQSADYFSIRWDGWIKPLYTETYTFFLKLYANTGVKITIGGNVVIDVWEPSSGSTEPWGQVQLTANELYTILVEFREKDGQAKIVFEWESVSQTREVVPSTAFYFKKKIGGDNYNGAIYIAPAATNAAVSEVTGDGLTDAVAGVSRTLSITAKDEFGNLQTDAGDESASFDIQVTPHGGSTDTFAVTAVDHTLGSYQGSYNMTAEGYHTVAVRFGPDNNKQTVSGESYTIWVYPTDVDGTYTEATLTEGIAGQEYSFEVHIKDKFGNYRNKTGDKAGSSDFAVTFALEHAATGTDYSAAVQSSALTDTKGVWTISYIATMTGQYNPALHVDGVSVTNINMVNVIKAPTGTTHNGEVTINEAKADAANSFVTTLPIAPDASPVTTHVAKTIEVQLVDVFGNNLEITGGSNDVWDYQFVVILDDNAGYATRGKLKAGTKETDGKVQIEFTAEHPGQFTLSVMLCDSIFPTTLGSSDSTKFPDGRGRPDGLTGRYYTNRWMMNDPVMTRIDDQMEFQWDTGLITDTAMDYVSVKWTGYIQFDHVETYTFYLEVDDGAAMLVNGTKIIDDFKSPANTYEGYWTPAASKLPYEIEIHYRENTGTASFKFEWQSTSTTKALVPTSNIFSLASHISGSPFTITAEDAAPGAG